jgi:TPR repeat protein
MQLPDEYLQPVEKPTGNAMKGTVIGQQAPNMSGTVIGSATPEYPDNTPKKSKTLLYAVIAVIIVAVLAVGWFLLGGQGEESQQEAAVDTEALLKEAEQAEYEACLSLLLSDQADSIQSALVRMTALADKGNINAIHEVAYTYAPIPNDQESDRRKRLLGWKIDADGIPTSPEINQQSINWLEKAIAGSDSTDYKALYWLTYFYINGTIVKTDFGKAMQLLVKASDEAGRQEDEMFKHNIDDIITQLRQIQ